MYAPDQYSAAQLLIDQRVRITVVGSGNVLTVTLIGVADMDAGVTAWNEGSVRKMSASVLVYQYDDGSIRALPMGLAQDVRAAS
jgi:hypothetical protein